MLLLPIILWWAKSPMRFSVGRSRQIICLVSLWAITAAALPTTRNVIASDPMLSSYGDSKQKSAKLIREGTEIPPTPGRVVMLGRRWAFVPDQDSLLHRQMMSQSPQDFLGFKQTNRHESMRISSQPKLAWPSDRDSVAIPMIVGVKRMMGQVSMVSTATPDASSTEPLAGASAPVHLVLAENLMLQRIVRSIRSDASDEHWTLSGTISEYFGENRMVANSAQRGNAE